MQSYPCPSTFNTSYYIVRQQRQRRHISKNWTHRYHNIPKSNRDPTQTSRPTEHIMTELIVDFSQVRQTAPASFPNKDKRRQRSSVSFAENASLQYVNAHENKRDLFYSKHELESIKHRNARQAKNMISSNMTMDQFAMEGMDTSIFLVLESCLSQSIYHEIFERRKLVLRQFSASIIINLASASMIRAC